MRKDVKLSSGRVIAHTELSNGAQQATPTAGDVAMTEAEWQEYCERIRDVAKADEQIRGGSSGGRWFLGDAIKTQIASNAAVIGGAR